MPLKKSERASGKKCRSRVSEAEVDAELDDMVARMPGQTKKQRKASDKDARDFMRRLAKAEAKWDAATPEWRAARTAEIKAEHRRRCCDAGPDDVRGVWAIGYIVDREKAKHEKKHPPAPRMTWADQKAEIDARRAALADRTGATATEAEPAPDEPSEAPKPRKRRPVGVVGYVDSRLYDFDEDDWNE